MRGIATVAFSALAIYGSSMSLDASATGASRHQGIAPTCAPGHRQILAADAQAQVYTQQHRVRVPNRATAELFGDLTDAVACAYGQRRTYDLGKVFGCERGEVGEPEECRGVVQEVLAGSTVAYEWRKPIPPFSDWFVIVRDLRTGRVLHREPTGASRGESEGEGATTALVVKSNGSVAWIVNVYGEAVYEVHAADTTGSRMLASGADIGATSLALAGSTIYWTQSGKPFAARLN